MHFRHFTVISPADIPPEVRGRGAHDGFGRERRFGRHWRGGLRAARRPPVRLRRPAARHSRHAGREAAPRLRDHQGARRAGRRRLQPEPRRRLSDPVDDRGHGLRDRRPGAGRAQALHAHRPRAKPSSPTTRPRSMRSSPASTARRARGAATSPRCCARWRTCAWRCACASSRRDARRSRIQAIADALDAAAKVIERA